MTIGVLLFGFSFAIGADEKYFEHCNKNNKNNQKAVILLLFYTRSKLVYKCYLGVIAIFSNDSMIPSQSQIQSSYLVIELY